MNDVKLTDSTRARIADGYAHFFDVILAQYPEERQAEARAAIRVDVLIAAIDGGPEAFAFAVVGMVDRLGDVFGQHLTSEELMLLADSMTHTGEQEDDGDTAADRARHDERYAELAANPSAKVYEDETMRVVSHVGRDTTTTLFDAKPAAPLTVEQLDHLRRWYRSLGAAMRAAAVARRESELAGRQRH